MKNVEFIDGVGALDADGGRFVVRSGLQVWSDKSRVHVYHGFAFSPDVGSYFLIRIGDDRLPDAAVDSRCRLLPDAVQQQEALEALLPMA